MIAGGSQSCEPLLTVNTAFVISLQAEKKCKNSDFMDNAMVQFQINCHRLVAAKTNDFNLSSPSHRFIGDSVNASFALAD